MFAPTLRLTLWGAPFGKDPMSYFSIRARLIFLAILLLAILAATAALLTRQLARNSEALSPMRRGSSLSSGARTKRASISTI